MRILVLSPTYPIPTDNGAKRRILAFTQHLSGRHEVTLAALREADVLREASATLHPCPWRDVVVDAQTSSRAAAWRSLLSRRSYRESRFWHRGLQRMIEAALERERFDVIWVHFVTTARYLEQWFDRQGGDTPLLILDQHNAYEIVWTRLLSSGRDVAWRIFARAQLTRLRRLQALWFPRFDAIISVSPEDLEETARYVDARTSLWLGPNGVDIEYFQPAMPPERQGVGDGPILVFGGSMDVAMNEDAAIWFAEAILPRIREKVPAVRFWVVGRHPPAAVRALARLPGVRVTGSVPDVRPYYGEAAVFVVPMRLGGGTKLKTLEAMAMGLPVVSTSVGAQGLEVESGRHLYVADDPEAFAARVVELLRERDRAVVMGAEARGLVARRYSWQNITQDVEDKLLRLAAQRQIEQAREPAHRLARRPRGV